MTQSNMNRRAMLAGAAAAIPAVALPTLAFAAPSIASAVLAEPDPTFAAIENFKRVQKEVDAIDRRANEIENRTFTRVRKLHARRFTKAETAQLKKLRDGGALKGRRPLSEYQQLVRLIARDKIEKQEGYAEVETLRTRSCEIDREALRNVACTVPTTLAGTIALTAFVKELYAGDRLDFSWYITPHRGSPHSAAQFGEAFVDTVQQALARLAA